MARQRPPRDARGRFVKKPPPPPLPPDVVEQLGRDYIDLVVHERNVLEVVPPRLVIDSQYLIPVKKGGARGVCNG